MSNAREHSSELYNVKTAGAVGDGTTDDSVAIQAAIDAVEAVGGGIVWFPRGAYRTANIFTVSAKGVRLVGESMYGVSILKDGADSSTVFFDNAACDLCEVSNIRFAPTSGTPSAGFVIQFNTAGSLGTKISRVLMEDVYSAIGCDMPPLSINDVIIEQCEFLRVIKYGLYLKGALNWMVKNNIVSMRDGAANTVALMLEANTEGCLFSDTYFVGGQYVLRSVNSNKENKFVQTVFDGGSISTAVIYDSGSVRNHFVNCWISTQATGGRGIVLDNTAVVGFQWIDGEIIGIQQHGIEVSAASSWHVRGGRICNWGIQAPATFSGITVAAGATMRFSVTDVVFAQDADISGNSWNGININSGAYANYIVKGNIGIGLTGALVADSGTCTTARVIDNPGYNPVGVSVIGAGASPYTYTAGHAPETVCITGGTVSVISVAGASIFGSTDRTVHLAPNQALGITHTVAPTLTINSE